MALVLIGAISLIRLYLGAHYPMDLLGGWMAGAALLSVLVSVHVLGVDERIRRGHAAAGRAGRRMADRGRPCRSTRRTPTTRPS